uniref:DUF4780 domain-containing protein n=1 Tax=Bactrocera latifrons TaxID=174628 RepID=A0A0K8VXE0_BACLA
MKKQNNNNTNVDADTNGKDIGKDIGAAAGKGGQGARWKFSFLDALSPEERALFEEHAREDDDVPSCSGARLGGTPGAAVAATSATRAIAERCSGSDSGESHRAGPGGGRKRKRRRRGRGGQRPLPEAGQPGGCDDPRRKGSTMKWYLRNLRDADAVKGIRMAVLPLSYPVESLTPEELTVLQDLLTEEVFRGEDYAASFLGVEFRGGMLQVDCVDKASADWLKEYAPTLGGWKGPVLCAKRAEDLPIMHSMTMFPPRCGDKPYEFVLALVKNQNRVLSISSWRVVSKNGGDRRYERMETQPVHRR